MKRSLWQRYLGWRLRNVEIVECDDDGFTHYFQKEIQNVRWDDIETIHAYKRDLWIVDCVCLAFATKNSIIEISEQTRGYSNVLEKLENRLGIAAEWTMAVMFPPFETNLTQIYPVVKTP